MLRADVEKMLDDKDPFNLDPMNTLGRAQKACRRKLYAEALSKPSDYIKMRDRYENEIINGLIKGLHDEVWAILTRGVYNGASQMTYLDGTPMIPGVPKPTVSDFLAKLDETIEDLFEECVAMILPADHEDLALARVKKSNQDGAV